MLIALVVGVYVVGVVVAAVVQSESWHDSADMMANGFFALFWPLIAPLLLVGWLGRAVADKCSR